MSRDTYVAILTIWYVFARFLEQESIRENIVQMPLDTKVLAQITPHSRPDLVPILEHATRQACICMGVPPSGLGVGGNHTALEAAASEGVLKSTLQRFRRSVTRCLMDVYVGLYGEKEHLTVFFPSLLNTATAKALFEEQVLTYDAFCEHIRTIYSVPKHNMVPEKDFFKQRPLAPPAPSHKQSSAPFVDTDEMKMDKVAA